MRDALVSAAPESVLDPKLQALLDYALRLTREPSSCRREDVDLLRAAGATDEEILATVQVAAYFNYVNRIADGLGVDPEPDAEDDPASVPPAPA